MLSRWRGQAASEVRMRTRRIGQGLEVPELALGCMGYGDPIDRQEMIALIRAAVERA